MTKLDALRKRAETARSVANEHRDAARTFVEFKDDTPLGFKISNGEMYHAHLRNAEHFEGVAFGIEQAIEFLRSEGPS